MKRIIALLLLVGCTSSTPVTEVAGTEMTMPYRILFSGGSREEVQAIARTTFDEIDTIFNDWNPGSEISKLNRLEAHQVVHLSPQMSTFLARVGGLVALTDGLFDPTVRPVHQLWKAKLAKGEVPSDEELEELREAVGWEKIRIAGGFFCKEHAKTQLDLGGVAKGYLVDLLVERLQAAGYENVYVSWSGEVRASGRHPRGRAWTVAVRLPGERRPATTLLLENSAVATSGDYLQNWEAEGVTYTHVIDPRTLYPLLIAPGSIASATVTAETCMKADALATAAMLGGGLDEQVFLLKRS